MKLKLLLTTLMALVIVLAYSSARPAVAESPDYSAFVEILAINAPCYDAPDWNCTTSVTRSGNTTTCTAKATSPGGTFNIYMYGKGPGGKALHTQSGQYYGSNGTKSCYAKSCSITFTYTGSARPTLCNWGFMYW